MTMSGLGLVEYFVYDSTEKFMQRSLIGGVVVGTVVAAELTPDLGYLENLLVGNKFMNPSVRLQLRRRGIGTQLHDNMVVWARERGLVKVFTNIVPKENDDLVATREALNRWGWVFLRELEGIVQYEIAL